MPLSYVDILSQKRRDVLREIEDLRGQVAELAARISTRENQLRNLDDLLAIEAPSSGSDEKDVAATVVATGHFLDRAHAALAAAGQPLHYRVLTQRVVDAGGYVPGKDPAANLLTQMTRDPRFARANGRGVYALADWPSVKAARSAPAGSASPRRRKVARRGSSRKGERGSGSNG
jgi:hypothetical protein